MKIGIVLATYRPHLGYLREQVQSLQRQTFADWVCYIVDDASGSEYADQIRNMIAEDLRFHFCMNSKNLGSAHNFVRALENLPKDIQLVSFCDQDDIWHAEKLAILKEKFSDSRVQLVHSDLSLIDGMGQQIANSCWKQESRQVPANLNDLIYRNPVTGCSMVFRASLIDFIKSMRIRSKNFYFHDQWIAVCAKLIGEVVAEERPLVKYRQHESNVVGSAKDSYLGLFRKLFAGEVLNKLAFSYFARRQLALDLTDRARHWQAAPIENLLEVDAVWFSFLGLFQFLRKKAFLSALDFRICTKILLGYVLFKIGYKYQDDNPIDQPDQRNIELD